MKKRWTAIVALLLALTLVLTGCGSGGNQEQQPAGNNEQQASGEPQVGGTLVVGISGDPYNLATWLSNDMNSSLVMNLVMPSLMSIDENGEKQPFIIESFNASEDLKDYTVKIHEGLSWHDGEPLTAEDLKFTAEYCVEHKLSYGADMLAGIESMEVIDDQTIIYHLTNPSVNFLTQMGFWVDIMPKHIYENVDDPMNFQFDGTGYGPYKLADYKKGEYYTLERVPNWPLANDGQGAYLEKIIFRVYPDPNALVLAMKNGEVDASGTSLPVAAQKQLEGSDQFTVERVESLGYGYFSFSYRNEFLKDQAVRQAIAMTIDRDAIVDFALQGGAVKMETPISPVFKDLTASNITFPALDIEGANKLLEDNGYIDSNGDGIREKDGKDMELTLTYRNNTANVDAIANIFKSNCEEAGIKINLQSLDVAAYTDTVTNRHDYDINVIEWGVIDDADSSLSTVYSSTSALNFMEYKNDKIDTLLADVKQVGDKAQRIEMMNEFQEEFVKELPAINVYVKTNAYGCSNKFAGWSLTPGLYGTMDAKDMIHVYQVAQ